MIRQRTGTHSKNILWLSSRLPAHSCWLLILFSQHLFINAFPTIPPPPSTRLSDALSFSPLTSHARDPVLLHDWSDRLTPYQDAWDTQHRLVDGKLASLADSSHEKAAFDSLLLVQHPPTYTLGTGSTPSNILFDPNDPQNAPAELFKTERGGEATWHGPGQLVAYPVLDLRHYKQDLHWYLRALEEVVIRTLAPLGVRGGREEGLTGVWVEGRKVAAVGVKVKRWITMHGVALNIDPPMEYFRHIVPCGIGDRPVGSLQEAWERQGKTGKLQVQDVTPLMVKAFEEVFGVALDSVKD